MSEKEKMPQTLMVATFRGGPSGTRTPDQPVMSRYILFLRVSVFVCNTHYLYTLSFFLFVFFVPYTHYFISLRNK